MANHELAQGCLLVASPALVDPNFARTVVLLITHDSEGSFGLVLNRPLDHRLADVLPDVAKAAGRIAVLQGGPVQPDVLQFVCRGEDAGRPVMPGVAVGAGLEELLASHPDGKGVRAYLGYAGWGSSQLEQETAEGSWIVAPARAEHVFDVPAGQLWASVLRELGGRYAWMAFQSGEPGNN